ncbi:MAG: response regulator, partial [Prolixibacteraceae bacterium]|nr:response regulator [Prolixibacteraceae bacterium]
AFSRKLSSRAKVKITLTTFYVLGIAILILMGQAGAGFNWLFLFPLLTGFFYGFRGVLFSTGINIISLALLTLPVYFKTEGIGLISEYSTAGWIVNSINFIVITTLVSLGLAVIISSIDKALKREKRMIQLLRENRKKLEKEKIRAEESDRLKSAFLANMSHEIRTPMNAILGFSGLLTEPELEPQKFSQYSSLIKMSGEQLLRIIDDIIDISKIEMNQMSIHLQPVQIGPALDEIVAIHRNKIESLGKNIHIQLQADSAWKDLVLETDMVRFEQIVNNLIGNAVKYSGSGTITVGYTVKNTENNPVAEFFVKDTGPGIPKESFDLIFERFSQADNVNFKEGAGLGLSITKGLLDLLGGKIWLKSEAGKGSEFYFTLPYKEKAAGLIANHSKTGNGKNYHFSDKLIYIAEDDTSSFHYFSAILSASAIQIKRAENGKELLRLMDEKTPDLILLDIRMPVMSGLEALAEIRKLHPTLPVIAQTAYAMPEERQKCLDAGCDDYISKPINPKTLLEMIESYLENA